MRTTLSFLLAFGLIGCSSIEGGPSFMPKGYSYHAEPYKSVPGAPVANIGYDYSNAKNDQVIAVWEIIAADLVDTLEMQTGLSPQMVYLEPANYMDSFYTTYDHVLRETLRDRGYTLLSSPFDDVAYITYSATDMVEIEEDKTQEESTETQVRNNRDTYGHKDTQYSKTTLKNSRDFMLEMSVMMDGVDGGTANGVYRVPAYKTLSATPRLHDYKRAEKTHAIAAPEHTHEYTRDNASYGQTQAANDGMQHSQMSAPNVVETPITKAPEMINTSAQKTYAPIVVPDTRKKKDNNGAPVSILDSLKNRYE